MSMNHPEFDPNRDPIPRTARRNDADRPGSNSMWAWVIGGLAALFLVIGLFSLGSKSNNTTANNPNATTTGAAPRATQPAAPARTDATQPTLPTPQNTRP